MKTFRKFSLSPRKLFGLVFDVYDNVPLFTIGLSKPYTQNPKRGFVQV